MKLTEKKLSYLKDLLLSEKERILNKLNETKENFYVESADRTDESDQAVLDYERGQMLRLRNRELFYLKKIDNALSQMDEGIYGECEDCGEGISFERLKARPTAELCINCKDDREKEENSNFFERKPKSIGKEIDLTR